MSKRNFPDFITAYLEFTRFHEASPKIHKWVAISIISAAMQRKVWMNRAFYLLFPNLYVVIVGQSGLVKKSTSTAIGVNMLREIEKFSLMSERVTAAAFLRQMASSLNQFEYRGAKINQSAVFCYASELKVFMEEVFGSMSELLTTFYDCQPNDPSKPWIYTNIHHGEHKIYGPCLSILGASTPAWLTRCIPAHNMEGGFASRCIFVAELKPPEKLVAWPELTEDLNGLKRQLIEDLKHIHKIAGPVHIEERGKKLYSLWYEHHMKTIIPKNKDERFAGYLGRKGDQILKLAMVKSISRGDDLEVTAEDILWATENLEELEPSMKAVFNYYDNDKKATSESITPEELKKIILYHISSHQRVSGIEMRTIFCRKFDPDFFLNILQGLIVEGKIVKDIVKNQAGPPTTYYFLSREANLAQTDEAVSLSAHEWLDEQR